MAFLWIALHRDVHEYRYDNNRNENCMTLLHSSLLVYKKMKTVLISGIWSICKLWYLAVMIGDQRRILLVGGWISHFPFSSWGSRRCVYLSLVVFLSRQRKYGILIIPALSFVFRQKLLIPVQYIVRTELKESQMKIATIKAIKPWHRTTVTAIGPHTGPFRSI